MCTLILSAPAKLYVATAVALLLLALSTLRQHYAAWERLRSENDTHMVAGPPPAVDNSTGGGRDPAAIGVIRRVDVLIPYSPDDGAVFLTADPSRGALASVLRYVSDLRTVFILANGAARQELAPVLRDSRVVFVDEDSVLPKADMDGWHYQQARPAYAGPCGDS